MYSYLVTVHNTDSLGFEHYYYVLYWLQYKYFLYFHSVIGVSLVISNLPTMNFLGIDITVVAIDQTEIPSTSHSGPLVLVIDNLPTKLSDDTIKSNLSYLFEQKGYKISECSRILNKRAHIMFDDANGEYNIATCIIMLNN